MDYEINAFAKKYLALYLDDKTKCYQVENHFVEECLVLRFEMDCGRSFSKKFPEAFKNAIELKKIIAQIDNPQFLGTAILSQWRFVTHWRCSDLLDDKNRQWFIIAFKRLIEITSNGKQLNISDLNIELTYKRIKNINLSVKTDGRICVSAPIGMPESKIIEFVSSKTDWIHKQQKRFESKTKNVPTDYVTGDTLYLWGEPYKLEVMQGRANKIRQAENVILLETRGELTVKQREKIVNEWYRAQLKGQISVTLPIIENKTNLKCSSWQTKNMTTRWGTCNTKTKKIWLNLQLAKKPPVCLEYVILHELVHTKISNHGADFKAMMDKHMPEWQDIRKMLNGGESV